MHTKPQNQRYPFPGAHFFSVPLKLYESGLAAQMSGSEFKRYCTLLRFANYDYGATEFAIDQKQLFKLDGVSPRAAFNAHTRLEEYGLIKVDRKKKPFKYTLVHPDLWPYRLLQLRELRRRGRIQVKTEYGPVPWT